MNKSESIKELATALAKAQGAMSAAKMDAVNPFLKNHYADLGSVIQAAKKPLADNGLSYSQHPSIGENGVSVTTLLMHSSGEWLESEINLPLAEDKGRSLAQSMGAIITYMRRYALAAILGIYADEDTDGDGKPATRKDTDKALGLKPKPEEPIPAPSNGDMTIEFAESEMSSTYKLPYGQIATEQLATMHLGMKKVKTPTEEQQRKIKAVEVIMAARAKGRPVQVAAPAPVAEANHIVTADDYAEPDAFAGKDTLFDK